MSADAGGGGDAGGAAGAPDGGGTDAGTPNDCGLSTAQFGAVPGGFWGIGHAYGYGGIGHDFPDKPKRHKRKHKAKR